MADTNDRLEETGDETPALRQQAPPIDSRFLFVDIAALRAKQLRRGALPRLGDGDSPTEGLRVQPHKAERVAMEEVRRGLVMFDVPQPAKPG